MGVFTRSRAGSILGGIAVVGVSAVFLAGCAGDSGGGSGTTEPSESLDLKIGTALPVTGNLAFLGPPEIAGTEYAASEVNAANAGVTIEMIQGDSGDTDNKAYETEIPRLLGEDVSAIIGAASSGTSLQFIDQVVGAGVIQFSPDNTSVAFSTYDDDGLYFRTAPSDVLQGQVLGNLIAGDTDNKAYETEIPRILGEGATAVIGAASSGTSLQFIDQVIAANAIQFSPANTSAAFTGYEDNGLYWRTAPSDVLQGEVLGNLIAGDGNETLGLLILNDSYGTGLACFAKAAFEAAGGSVVAASLYNTGDTNFSAQVSDVLAADPDAIALITFEEVKTIIPELLGADFPADKMYFVDGNLANFGDEFDAGTLAGAKGTYPAVDPESIAAFRDALQSYWTGAGNAELADYTYAPESYDAVILLALAALEAGSSAGPDVAAHLQQVSGGAGNGTKCTSYGECADIIIAGGVADYDGVSGPITFNEVGDPTQASIGIFQYGDDNNYSFLNVG